MTFLCLPSKLPTGGLRARASRQYEESRKLRYAYHLERYKSMKQLLLVVLLALSSSAQIDARTIIERSVHANAQDWNAAPDYDHFERDRQSGGGSKTYEVMMILGSPYSRLVAMDGTALPQWQQEQEQQKLAAVLTQRRNESLSERSERIAKYEKSRQRDRLLMDQLTKAMDFALVGEQELNGRQVYALKATPRADYQPPTMEAEVLRGMEGELWIDDATFQWMKVQARVIRPVSIEGFLARVESGTRFQLEKMPVTDNIWLPSHFSMKSQARVLFFFTRKSDEDETYYDYNKATAEVPTLGK
jgi:hypothetical protein